ncbi:MAG: ABC transporter permease [Clostridia bacterium]|nr:ABC transporter permease [Clostridia bacterium]
MRIIYTIFKKELLGIFRDKSILIVMLIPLLIFPVFNTGLKYLNKDNQDSINIAVTTDSAEAYNIFSQYIIVSQCFRINLINTDTPEEDLKKGILDCYLYINEGNYDFIHNSNSYNSISTTTKLGEDFQKYYNEFIKEMYTDVYQFNLKDETGKISNVSDSISNMFIPIFLVLIIFQSISSFSNDFFAGEKERKTLEMLLLSGTKKEYIYFGKMFALFTVSLFNIIFSGISLLATFAFEDNVHDLFGFFKNGSIITNISIMILSLWLLALIAVSLSSNVSIVSKGIKNSQFINEVVVVIPVSATVLNVLGYISAENTLITYIPIVNLVLCFNNAFKGFVRLNEVLITVLVSIIFVFLMGIFGIKYMKSERFLNSK